MRTADVLPELSLLGGILERALRDVVDEGIEQHIRRAAVAWFEDDSDRDFGFRWICMHLELRPEAIRRAIQNLDFGDKNTMKPTFDAMVRRFSAVYDEGDFEVTLGRETYRYG